MQDGIIKHGTVSKGGSRRVTVILDGGEYKVTASSICFSPSTKAFPKDVPNSMDDYAVIRYKEIPGHGDSRIFDAVITYKGKSILSVRNCGLGGSNKYHSMKIKDNDSYNKFIEDIKSTIKQFGYADFIEPEDAWVEWYIHSRPYAVTFQEEVKKYKDLEESFK